MSSSTILVVGAGFSGSLAALHLLARSASTRVVLAERGEGFGPGLAYGAAHGEHLLNVRAGNMSAFPSRPGHFVDWLQRAGGQPEADGAAFASRRTYGAYLQQLLREAATGGSTAGRLQLAPDAVVDLTRGEAGGLVATFAMGRSQVFGAAVLAPGALPPSGPSLPDASVLAHPRYVANPWAKGALANVRAADTVMLLGAGLTMVDVVTTLTSAGLKTPIRALSRRGLLPNRHAGAPAPAQAAPELGGPLSAALRTFRQRARDSGDWRTAFDALRPLTAGLWGAMSEAERKRFLRHLRPYWDVHRHRMAPTASDRLGLLLASGRLVVVGGRLTDLRADGERLIPTWRPRGATRTRSASVDWLINCTGQGGDVERSTDPLFASLVRQGMIRGDRLRLGIEVDAHCQVVDAQGRVSPILTAIGPLTRGTFWESTAVPDIRVQAEALAAFLESQLTVEA